MAIARTIAGRPAMFTVVPLLGAFAVWWTFILARRIGGDAAGAIAAVLLAASPPFLYQIVQPMSDVPATALWAAALVCLTSDRFARSFASALSAGLVTGAALIVRPNLLPCVAVAALAVFTERAVGVRDVVRTWVALAAGVAPFAIAVAALQNTMYGGPFKSGYGDLDFLFRLSHVWPNLQRYPLWLVQTETPIVLLALASPLVASRRRTCVWLLAFVAAVCACYLPYEVFDAWWYLRFLLPAYPAMLALTACVVSALGARAPARWRVPGFVIVAAIAVFMVRVTNDRGTFGLRDFERRFRLAGDYVASHLPENAAVVTGQESGSVRFYAGRLTLFWRELPADSLDRALDFLLPAVPADRNMGVTGFRREVRWRESRRHAVVAGNGGHQPRCAHLRSGRLRALSRRRHVAHRTRLEKREIVKFHLIIRRFVGAEGAVAVEVMRTTVPPVWLTI